MINKIFALPVVEQLTPVLSRRQIDGADYRR
jgi:glucose-6-phosphate 1-epimerase